MTGSVLITYVYVGGVFGFGSWILKKSRENSELYGDDEINILAALLGATFWPVLVVSVLGTYLVLCVTDAWSVLLKAFTK